MTAAMSQIGSDDRSGERGNNASAAERDGGGGSAGKRGGYSASDGCQCVCKAREQETGLSQTQHPAAADISSLAAMKSHSAQ